MNEVMNDKIAQEILHGLFPAFEALETQSAALLQLLKDKGMANEGELAAHFEQAGKASSVKWLAVRVRIDYLLSSATKTAEQDVKKESPKTAENPLAETSREREITKILSTYQRLQPAPSLSQTTLVRVRKTARTSKAKKTVRRVKKRQKMQPEDPVGTDPLQKHYNHTNERVVKRLGVDRENFLWSQKCPRRVFSHTVPCLIGNDEANPVHVLNRLGIGSFLV
jgi:hypothetical protein